MLNIESDYIAYCLDDAIFTWGSYVEAELDKASEKAKTTKAATAKRSQRLRKLLGMKPKYADPMGMMKKQQ